ncbi:hypothetical protein DS885_11385 [Psychromonas sp. B3M02]|uniref:helix-turn-helix domain-containing protein n=1 Tax=Psychromonas sp. B3M02 TaxID=2267226 RepID=UPI000DE8CD70|nr:helix-turn-helix domain-containing protein [Psychromonas sp. B3M02]RBW44566.1 hypothetical protein DS885_11385 [Psychromonas sp. B3M02]
MTLDNALKEQRVAANLSVEDIALKLNLKVTVINDIENDLEQVIEEKRYPVIYLRGYLANYAKAVQLPEIESYAEYQQLSTPSKHNNTLSNPYLLSKKKTSSNKFGWFIFLLFVAGIATVVTQWESISTALYKESSVDTENIHMRLPEPESTHLIVPLNEQSLPVAETPEQVTEIQATDTEQVTENQDVVAE